MNILFDSMGAQVQIQNETSNRLQTLFSALGNLFAGDNGTGWPAPGEIANGCNLTFLLNCIRYLGGGASS